MDEKLGLLFWWGREDSERSAENTWTKEKWSDTKFCNMYSSFCIFKINMIQQMHKPEENIPRHRKKALKEKCELVSAYSVYRPTSRHVIRMC